MSRSRPSLSAERALAIIEAYGGDPKRWPAAERSQLNALLAHNAQLAAAVDAARQLDGWLDRASVTAPSDALRERVAAQAPRAPRPSVPGWVELPDWLRQPAGAIAACLTLGLAIGLGGGVVAFDENAFAGEALLAASLDPPFDWVGFEGLEGDA
ncbi:MAG: hypothetical protein ACFB2Z_02585 [Maricaulaceae bacterium]